MSKYWTDRALEVRRWIDREDNDIVRTLTRIYRVAGEDLEKEKDAFYTRYADDAGIDYATARQRIDAETLENFEAKIERYTQKEFLNQHEEEALRRLRAKERITRLDILEREMELRILQLGADEQITFDEYLARVGMETSRKLAAGLSSFVTLNEEAVKAIAETPWSGKNYSSRIWKNKQLLVDTMEQELTRGFIKGSHPRTMGRELRKTINTSRYNAERLMRTESSQVLSRSSAATYQGIGYKKYTFVAEVDDRTSDVCLEKDGTVYRFEDMQIGVNAPPLHPNCRSDIQVADYDEPDPDTEGDANEHVEEL